MTPTDPYFVGSWEYTSTWWVWAERRPRGGTVRRRLFVGPRALRRAEAWVQPTKGSPQ